MDMAVDTVPPGGWKEQRRAARVSFDRAIALRRSPVSIRAGMLPWVPFWMALGIGGWFSIPFEPGVWLYSGMALVAVVMLALLLRLGRLASAGRIGWSVVDQLRILCLAVLLIVLGGGVAGLRSHLVAAPILDFRYYGPVEGRVIKIDRSARDRLRLTLDQVVLDDVRPDRLPERVRISLFQPDPLPIPGQRVMLTAHLGPPPGPAEPGGFDFRRMAWFERLGAIGYSRNAVMTVEPARSGGALALHRLRMRLSAAIADSIGGQAGAVSAAMMTGDRSGIAEKTNEVMRASNLYHIVSISGLHMSMLAGFVYATLRVIGTAILGLLGRGSGRVHKFAAVCALFAAAFYLWLSGGDVATTRSFIMVAVMLVAIIADRRAISLRTVAVAAIVILALTPEALLSAGFQMSFAATVALVLVSGPWQRVSSQWPFWLKPIAMLLLSSLVASMATSPLAAAHFGRIAHYGIFANLLVVPVIGILVMPMGAIAAVLGLIGLEGAPLWFMGLGTRWMLSIAEYISSLHGATTLLPRPPNSVVPLLGVGACLMFLGAVQALKASKRVEMTRRALGVACVIAALTIWATDERPIILISPDGDAVGIMTDQGRSISKPKGGAYVVAEWLEADGDSATQEVAAARPAWSGPNNARTAIIRTPAGVQKIHHITGASAPEMVDKLCVENAVIVSSEDLPKKINDSNGCVIIDKNDLIELWLIDLNNYLTSKIQLMRN